MQMVALLLHVASLHADNDVFSLSHGTAPGRLAVQSWKVVEVVLQENVGAADHAHAGRCDGYWRHRPTESD
jgi:hypothetical protein